MDKGITYGRRRPVPVYWFATVASFDSAACQPTSAATIEMVLSEVSTDTGVQPDKNKHFSTEHLKEDLGRRTARGGAVTAASQGVKFAVSMAATVVLARLLTPLDYGLIGMVAILINFVSMFQYMGLSTATVKWAELNHKQVSSLFWVNVGLSTGIALLTIAIAPLLAWFYKEPRLISITVGYALTLILSGLAIQHEALLSRQMRFGALAAIEVVSLVLGFLAAIIAAWFGAGYWALVVSQVTITFTTLVGVWVACGWRPGLPARNTGVRSMLSYGGNLTGFNVMTYFSRNLDNALIGKVWGAYQLGLYAKAYQMLLIPMQQINAPFAAVAVPALSRLADSPERYRRAYLSILEKIAMITMPGVALMIATSDWLVLFLLGPQWQETSRIFMLLGVAAMIQPVTKTTWWLFSTQGRTNDLFRWGVIGGTIAIVSIVIGLPWGAIGVAATYSIGELCLSTPLLFWFVGRQGPIRAGDFYRTIVPSICAALFSIVVLVLCRPWLTGLSHLFWRLSFALIIAMVTSLLVFVALPQGRRALHDAKAMSLLLMGRKSNAES